MSPISISLLALGGRAGLGRRRRVQGPKCNGSELKKRDEQRREASPRPVILTDSEVGRPNHALLSTVVPDDSELTLKTVGVHPQVNDLGFIYR